MTQVAPHGLVSTQSPVALQHQMGNRWPCVASYHPHLKAKKVSLQAGALPPPETWTSG